MSVISLFRKSFRTTSGAVAWLTLGIITFAVFRCTPQPSYVGAQDSWIDVSPDGSRLVFSARGNGARDLYLLDLRTNVVGRLTDSSSYENFPSFSPDGKQIVFQRGKSLTSPRYLYLMDLSSRVIRQVTGNTFCGDSCPRFSDDGKLIVFERATSNEPTTSEDPWSDGDIYLVRPDGSGLRRITYVSYDCYLHPCLHNSSSPIVYSYDYETTPDDLRGAISKIDYSVGKTTVIRCPGTINYDPFLMRDGKSVVFVSATGLAEGRNLYVVSITGAFRPRCLYTSSFANWANSPTATADGRSIYFIGGDPTEIWRINSDGTGRRRIADSSIFDDPMNWKPAK